MSTVALGFLFSLLTALLVIAADVFIKLAADGGKSLTSGLMLVSYVLYAVSAIAWYMTMRHVALGQGGVAYSMFSLLALCAIGAIAFGEPIRLREVAGIGCALLSIFLMARIA